MTQSSALDSCLTPVEEVANKLKSFVVGEDNKLDEFLRKGEISQAAQLSLAVLKAANEKTDCGQELSSDAKQLVSKDRHPHRVFNDCRMVR